MRSRAPLSLIAAVAAAPLLACTPTTANVTPITPPTSTTGSSGGSKAMCDSCAVDTDCGEAGVASCIFENVLPGGHCAPVCISDADCGLGASCLSTSSTLKVCYPSTQTCEGYDPSSTSTGGDTSGATSNGATATTGSTTTTTTGTTGLETTTTSGATTTGSTTSSGTTTGSTTSSASSTTTGTSGSSCPGYADPNTPAGCTCSSGHTCGANNCYGGWYCELSDDKCVAPPSNCSGSTGTSASSTTGSTTTGTTGTTGSGGTSGAIGVRGGTVNLLHFAISGDTRPPSCEDTSGYPTAIINSIGDAEKAAGAQFALDLGDHMYVCNNSASIASQQMGLFMQGTQHFGGTWFMTEGNHECMGTGSGYCPTGSTNTNFTAFMSALAPISSTPYYSVNIQTSLGLATFVFVADNSFDTAQQTWLKSTLTTADQNAKYTIIAKHHPEGDTSVAANSTIMSIIRAHKFALLLTGHTHSYTHQTTDNGRDLVLGNGGAPLVSAGTFNGYGMIDELSNGQLQVSIYDVASGSLHDQWSVGPN